MVVLFFSEFEAYGLEDVFFDIIVVFGDFVEMDDGCVGEVGEECSVAIHPPPAGFFEVGHCLPIVVVGLIIREGHDERVVMFAFFGKLSIHG